MGLVNSVLLLLLTIQLVSCADNIEQFRQSVINGKKVEKNSVVAKSTVSIVAEYGNRPLFMCSGTLVSKRIVITATHCLNDIISSVDFQETRYVFFGVDRPKTFNDKNLLPIEKYSLNPNLMDKPGNIKTEESIAKSSLIMAQSDIAIIVLQQDAPDGYEPVPILENTDFLKVDSNILAAGVGVLEDTYSDDAFSNNMNQVSLAIVGFNKNIMIVDQTKKTGVCHGDSGGPAYLVTNNGLVLVGATKGPHGEIDSCLQLGEFTLLGVHKDLIMEMVQSYHLKPEYLPHFIRL